MALSAALIPAASVFAAPFVVPRDPQCVDWSEDGKLIATGISGESSGEAIPKPHPLPRKSGVLLLWDAETGKSLHRIETFGDFTAVRFSPDSKRVATSRLFSPGEGAPWNEVRVYDTATGECTHHFDRCHAFSFSADGAEIAIVSRTRCAVYDLDSQKKLRELEPLGGAVAIAWSPTGELVAGIVADQGRYSIRFCSPEGSLRGETAIVGEPFYSLAWAPDGARIASGHSGGIVFLWDVDELRTAADPTNEPAASLPRLRPAGKLEAATPELMRPFFSLDGRLIGAGGQDRGTVVVWDAATYKELHRHAFDRGGFRPYYRRPAEVVVRPERDPNRFCFSPDGTRFLAGCYGGIIRRVDSGAEERRLGEY